MHTEHATREATDRILCYPLRCGLKISSRIDSSAILQTAGGMHAGMRSHHDIQPAGWSVNVGGLAVYTEQCGRASTHPLISSSAVDRLEVEAGHERAGTAYWVIVQRALVDAWQQAGFVNLDVDKRQLAEIQQLQ